MFDVARSCLYAHRERVRHIDVERVALRSRVHELFVESRSSAGSRSIMDMMREEGTANAARRGNDRAAELRSLRDKSLILLGFWRGFRSDELSRLRVEHVEANAGEGISCFLGRTKGDRQNLGSTFRAPALSRLCPVEAYLGSSQKTENKAR